MFSSFARAPKISDYANSRRGEYLKISNHTYVKLKKGIGTNLSRERGFLEQFSEGNPATIQVF